MSDPYQPPRAAAQPSPVASLYSVQGIVIGTLIGSLAAGIVMLYMNYRSLGRETLAIKVASWGSAFCIVLIAATAQLPNTPLTSLVMIGIQAGLSYFLADRLQGAAIAYHREHRGAIHSGLRAAGIGALTGLIILVGLLTVGILWAVVAGPPAAGAGT